VINGKPRTRAWKVLLLCIVSALGNIVTDVLVSDILRAPLYLDTVFTAAVTFSFGLLPGILTGAAHIAACNILYSTLLNPGANILTGNVFFLCTVSEILLVCFFRARIKPQEAAFLEEPSLSSFISIAAPLMVLVVLDCILISITGGVIDFILNNLLSIPRGLWPEDIFKLGLIRNNVPVLAAAILSRIPINIVDRFIAVFGGYGISLLYRKWVLPEKPGRMPPPIV
jgi:hypothetical protein